MSDVPDYHCKESKDEDTTALCGIRPKPRFWDTPIDFMACTDWERGDVYCTECKEHPDLPMLVLKELADNEGR